MSEDTTEDLPGKESFEARVFERFDAMDVRLNTVDARLEKLEARSYDTKPIWEQALREIVETRAEVGQVHSRVALLETEVAAVKANYGGIKNDFEDLKRELVRQLTRRLDLVLKALVDTRDEMAAAEERITKLESQLA
jgi:chromosome segregation ATPase